MVSLRRMSNNGDIHSHRRGLFAALLRGEYDRDDPLLADDDFWYHARMEGVSALLWHRLTVDGVTLPQAVVETMADTLREQAIERSQMRRAAAQVLQALADDGVRVVVLRGLALAEYLYPRVDLRVQSDLDLLVKRDAMARALQRLRGLGFTPINDWQPHLLGRGSVLIDLHDEPLGADRIRSWRLLTPLDGDTFFAHAVPSTIAGSPAWLVTDRLQLPWLCFHALKHSFERMVWLWDIALLADRISREDGWEPVVTQIEALGLARPCYFSLRYAAARLGAAVPDRVLAVLRPAMDWRERALLRRHLDHEQIPFLAERIFARMIPSLPDRIGFWRETVVPRREVREQIAAGGCVRCTFIRTRLRQLLLALALTGRELRGWWSLGRGADPQRNTT